MSSRPYRHAVLIGRFQPFHLGHRAALAHGLALAERVAVVIGSARRPRTARDLWTAEEREAMVRASLAGADAQRIDVLHQRDHLYDEVRWAAEVAQWVAGLEGAGPVALLGAAGEPCPFPGWTLEAVPGLALPDAEAIRAAYLTGGDWAAAVPEPVRAMLRDWAAGPDYPALAEEWRYLAEYRARWAVAPFPAVFTTVDAVVTGAGRVLMIRRAGQPGRGLLALPGGFLDAAADPSLRAGALRELREETGLALAGPIAGERAFDHPQRSLRGRTITYAVHFDLGPGPLPAVQGGDDASHALWVPLADLEDHPETLFEDHGEIVRYFAARA